jgi:hypothetical protein
MPSMLSAIIIAGFLLARGAAAIFHAVRMLIFVLFALFVVAPYVLLRRRLYGDRVILAQGERKRAVDYTRTLSAS